MYAWLSKNLGTIVVVLILIAVVTAVIVNMIKDKKRGRSVCGGDCCRCGSSKACGNKQLNIKHKN